MRSRAALLCAGSSPVHSVVRSSAIAAIRLACCDDDGAALREFYDLKPSVVVIEIGGAGIRESPRIIRLVKSESPNTYVIGYCSLSARAGDEVVLAAQAGLDTVVFEGRADVQRVLYNRISEHVSDSPAAGLLNVLRQTLHPLAIPVAEQVLGHAAAAPNVNDVARTLGCTPRTLARRFAKAGLMPPDVLITQLRWSRIADLLAGHELTSSEIARTSGFRNTRAMRAALKRRLRTGLTQLSDIKKAEQLRRSLVRDFGRDRGTRNDCTA
jgi:AraC-like DNA-binding protein